MIDITTVERGFDTFFIHYSEKTKKHTLVVTAEKGGLVSIAIDRADFGDFMTEVVKSFGESSTHLIEEIKQEILNG